MKRKKRLVGVLMLVTALIIMQLPVSEADAAASASDFKIEGSTLVKYRGTEKNVSVPNTVTVIGRGAFEDDTNIELVVLPNSVIEIEPYAFWGCDNLDTVVLGKEITAVGDYAFAGCKGLEQMTIPEGVASIGVQAFGDCVNLKNITIPVSAADIHESAFDGCAKLTIHCEPGSKADEYAKAFYERQKEMPEYEDVPDYNPSEPVVPGESDTEDPSPSPEPVNTPEPQPGDVLGTTQVVGNKAVVFLDNRELPVYGNEHSGGDGSSSAGTGEIPGDAAEITTDLVGSGSIPKFTIVDGKVVADQAYYRSEALDNIVLPEGVSEIGQFSFARSALKSVSLPMGMERIGYGAFYHCDYLEDVVLPDSIVCVEPKAFDHTLWKERFLQGEGDAGDFLTEGGVLVAYRGDTAEVRIPEGVRVIAGEAFRDHEEIKSVVLPDSLVVAGEGAFEGCSGLASIVFGENVEEIKDRAFKGCAIKEVTIPESVKKIGLQAFGDAMITYAGKEAEYTYESSASRLSNDSYRVYGRMEDEEAGVAVSGMENSHAMLEGADRSYVLKIGRPADVSPMENAFMRSFRTGIPENMSIFDMVLTDGSNIPLVKLGRQTLTVVIPVPDALKGQALRLFGLDGNGQLEMLPVERVSAEGVESMRFETKYLSMFGVCGLGDAEEELTEISVDLDRAGAAPGDSDVVLSAPKAVKRLGAAIFLAAGLFLMLNGRRKRGSAG